MMFYVKIERREGTPTWFGKNGKEVLGLGAARKFPSLTEAYRVKAEIERKYKSSSVQVWILNSNQVEK